MKLKYYLRGLGIGIIVTTIILMICFSMQDRVMSDEEVMQRAAELGMILPEEDGVIADDSEMEETEHSDSDAVEVKKTETEMEGTLTDDTMTAETETVEAAVSDIADTMVSEAVEAAVSETADTVVPETADTVEVYRLVIQRGDVCRTVCDTLAANGVIEDSETFRKYLLEIGYASYMSTGEYDVPYGLTMEEVAQVLMAGPLADAE